MGAVRRLAPGEIFAQDFRVIAPLREGGMGAVYVVDQLSTGARRALKLMLPDLASDAALRQRFEQEARIGSRIDSDHVVQVVAAGFDAATRTPWLAMELLSGADLAGYLRSQGPVSPGVLLAIFEQLCHAMAAAHAIGIVHRDLKPENIFIARGRRVGSPFTVKVLDFGIAKLLAEAKTNETVAIGTPMWMSPEQTSSHQPITQRTDVWALGLIAFWMLTGRSYWRASSVELPTVAMFLREILIDELPPASARAAELGTAVTFDRKFDVWFSRCVAREPEARFANAGDAFAALAPVFSVPSVAPLAGEGHPSVRETTKDGPRDARAAASAGPLSSYVRSKVSRFVPSWRERRPTRPPIALAGAATLAVAVTMGVVAWRGSRASASHESGVAGFDAAVAAAKTLDYTGSAASSVSSVPRPPSAEGLDRERADAGLRVTSHQDDVDLLIDGQRIGALPQEVTDLSPGPHQLLFRGSDRYVPEERNVVLASGEVKDLGTIALKVARGLATFDVRTPGVKLTLVSGGDRRELTDFSRPVEIDTSKNWAVEASDPRYQEFRQALVFDDRPEKTFVISLLERGEPNGDPFGIGETAQLPSAACTLNFNSLPVSKVVFDGRPIGGTPVVAVTANPGEHTVMFVHPERGKKVTTFTCRQGEAKTVAIRFTP